jgi:Butirosin biosynthesis protein H, N-terminal/Domain of unknown function (DUF4872)
MVPGYRHRPGLHCGSTALRNLLAFHGVELSEEMAFGLGAGACFYFVPMDESSPSRFTNGRTSRLEEQFVELTGAPLELRTFDDPETSWAGARDAVAAGAPPLILTDLYYLDHYGKSAHFPGHAVVLAGFDDEVAYLSDTAFGELQTTGLGSLREARHAQHPVFPLAGHMFLARHDVGSFEPSAAIPRAIRHCARRMLEPPLGEYEGLPGLRRFAAEVGSWPELLDDWPWTARFNYQVIERRGTGGGNFRLMYSRFLDEAGYAGAAGVAAAAAAAWTELAGELLAASEEESPSAERWGRIGDTAHAVLATEERLWEELS